MLALRTKKRRGVDDAATHDWASKKYCWIPDDALGFVTAMAQGKDGDKVTVTREVGGGSASISQDDVLPMNPPKFDQAEDMADLPNLNEPCVLFNLQDRYNSDLIYVRFTLGPLGQNAYQLCHRPSSDLKRLVFQPRPCSCWGFPSRPVCCSSTPVSLTRLLSPPCSWKALSTPFSSRNS